jgi:hypothetical protein
VGTTLQAVLENLDAEGRSFVTYFYKEHGEELFDRVIALVRDVVKRPKIGKGELAEFAYMLVETADYIARIAEASEPTDEAEIMEFDTDNIKERNRAGTCKRTIDREAYEAAYNANCFECAGLGYRFGSDDGNEVALCDCVRGQMLQGLEFPAKPTAKMKDILTEFDVEKDLLPFERKICKDFIEAGDNGVIFEDIIRLVHDVSYARIEGTSLHCIWDKTLYHAIYSIVVLVEKMRGCNSPAVEREFNDIWGEKRHVGWHDYESRVKRLFRPPTSGIKRTKRETMTAFPFLTCALPK